MINSIEEFEKFQVKVKGVKALAERGATPGERAAAEAALDRLCPERHMSDEELLEGLFG